MDFTLNFILQINTHWPNNLGNQSLPVIISLSHVMETIAELLMPEAGNASAWGKFHSSEPDPAGPLNMRMNAPLVELALGFPCWKRNGAPWPSGVFGCHLCWAMCADGAFISTITRESEDVWIAAAGRLQRSGEGTTYGLTSLGFLKMVWKSKNAIRTSC